MRIGPGFSIIVVFFYVFFAVFWVLKRQGAMGENVVSEIDRAR